MSNTTGIDWPQTFKNSHPSKKIEPATRSDVRYALAAGFELDEALWMLGLSDRESSTTEKL